MIRRGENQDVPPLTLALGVEVDVLWAVLCWVAMDTIGLAPPMAED